MPQPDPAILAAFAASTELSDREARAILREASNAILDIVPPSAGQVEYRERLLEVLDGIAAGGEALAKAAARLPYAEHDARAYLQSAARAFLEQAERDAAAGLNPAASVFVEVGRAAGRPSHIPAVDGGGGGVAYPEEEPFGQGSANLESPSESEGLERVSRARLESAAASDPGSTSAEPLDDDIPNVEALQANEYRVWFGTNRKAVDGGTGGFTNRRGQSVSYGFCDVYIPKSHKIGSLGSSFLTRLVTWTDDRLKLRRTCPLAADAYWSLLRSQLESVDDGRRHAVVFIHGYNVAFEEAALRAAQIGFDIGVEGAMAFFSWPSMGTLEGYPADEATIEASEPAITDFLVDFARRSGADAIHVIAHSMGNRGVLRAVSKMVQSAQAHTDVHFANFILAAPDVDSETFGNLASAYRDLADRTTLYISESDRAVGLSQWISGYPRVGFAPPISVFDGIDTVNVTNIDLTLLGHSYVAEARGVLADMHALIFEGLPPAQRFSLRAAQTDSGQPYWIVRD